MLKKAASRGSSLARRVRPAGVSLRKEAAWRRRTLLPTPPTEIILRDHYLDRLGDHYATTLRDDLMILTYKHLFQSDLEVQKRREENPRVIRPLYDPENPYTKHRTNPPAGGTMHTGILRKPLPPSAPENIIELESIHLHTFAKSALNSRTQLLPTLMALRMLSGESKEGGGHHAAKGVEIVISKAMQGGWIRPGLPCGVKVEMTGPRMYTFLNTFVNFVLPRMKDFTGFELPSPRANSYTPSAVSGTVSIGLPPAAMSLFPQLELNADSYPRIEGMHIHFVTNARGLGATSQARQLLSGFQIPFVRR
jgi:large subunit ribosomal protein L5